MTWLFALEPTVIPPTPYELPPDHHHLAPWHIFARFWWECVNTVSAHPRLAWLLLTLAVMATVLLDGYQRQKRERCNVDPILAANMAAADLKDLP